MAATSYFKIILPVKPYLYKYLKKQYGEKILCDLGDWLGMFIATVLTKSVYPQMDKVKSHNAALKAAQKIEINLPRFWLVNYFYGQEVEEKHIIYINNFLALQFQKELFYFCESRIHQMQRKEAMLQFCQFYQIEIDEDITMDALIKMEFRFREKELKQKKTYTFVLSKKKAIQTAFFP